jgi:hypothetical protein
MMDGYQIEEGRKVRAGGGHRESLQDRPSAEGLRRRGSGRGGHKDAALPAAIQLSLSKLVIEFHGAKDCSLSSAT